jgi:CDP-2,3-bis-(O-geranylgeranyl)-sn-glycerol synthase
MRKFSEDPNIASADIRKEKIFVVIITASLLIYTLIWSLVYSISDAIAIMGLSFLILVPAFVTNGMMVIAGTLKIKRFPIDNGKTFKDGERIFGEGKSWNGFIGGWISGFLISAAICWFFFLKIQEAEIYSGFKFIDQAYITNFISAALNPTTYWLSQCFIALGSPVGDLIGSFFKRRKKVKRGEVYLFWDQNDFVIVSSLIACIWYPYDWYFWIFVLLITPILTALANWVGYLIGKKDVPW